MATKQEIIDHLSQCGGLSYQWWIYLLDSIYFDGDVGDIFEPITGTVLPDPEVDYTKVSIVGQGTYTFAGQPNIVVPANNLGILSWDGTKWSLLQTVPLPIQDISGLATKVALDNLTASFNAFQNKILEQPTNLFVKANIGEGHYIQSTTGALTPVPPATDSKYATSGWIDVTNIPVMYLSGNASHEGARFKDASGNLIKPLNADGTSRSLFTLSSKTDVVILRPTGAVGFEFTVRFNDVDSRDTIVLESGSVPTTKIRESLIPKLKDVDTLKVQMANILSQGKTIRENSGEKSLNPQYYDDTPESPNRFKIEVVADTTSPTKDIIGFKRIFSNTLTANQATCFQSVNIVLGTKRPSIISFAMWINKAQYQSIYNGTFVNYIGFRSYQANASLILAGTAPISEPADTTPIAEYTTAKAEFKVIEEINGWIRLRITYFDILWKPTFTGTTIANYFHLSKANAFGKSLEISDFTVLFDEYISAGFTYGDPNGAFDSTNISLKYLKDSINATNQRVTDLENKLSETGGASRLLIEGDTAYISSPFSDTRELVKKMVIRRPRSYSSNPNANFLVSYLINKDADLRTELLRIKDEGDDITPAFVNGSYISGNHGWNHPWILTVSAGHNKTLKDVGSLYSDVAGDRFVIMRIASPTQLIICSLNLATDGFTYNFKRPTTALTYVSGGDNTDPMSTYTTAGISNLWPSLSQASLSTFVDGNLVTGNFDGKCDKFDIHESVDIYDLPSILDKLVANRPAGGYTSDVYYNEIGADKLFRMSLVYSFDSDGATVVIESMKDYKKFVHQWNGVIQIIALTTGNLYIPKSLPISDGTKSYDFRQISNWSVAPASNLNLTTAYWENPLSPPDRSVMFNNNIILNSGYILDKGQGVDRKSRIDDSFFLATSRKLYPRFISIPFNMENNDFYSGMAFRIYTNPANNPVGRTNYSFFQRNDEVYMWMDYHGSIIDHIKMKDKWSGMKINVIEKSNNIKIQDSIVSDSITVISTAEPTASGYLVLKLTV